MAVFLDMSGAINLNSAVETRRTRRSRRIATGYLKNVVHLLGDCALSCNTNPKLKVRCCRVRPTHRTHWCVGRTLHDYCCSKIESELTGPHQILKLTVTRNPRPSLAGCICKVAPCTSAIRWTMDRPRPLPLACVSSG